MILCDVNVLLYAFRRDSEGHADYRGWLIERLAAPENFGVSDMVLGGLTRIATHPRVFRNPSAPSEVFAFAEALRTRPNAVIVTPGPRHWTIFRNLLESVTIGSKTVRTAFLAALAIDWGCEWVTTDPDYRSYPGLRCRHPLHDKTAH
jgi:toxin-antitoxin system PIN domain toxin